MKKGETGKEKRESNGEKKENEKFALSERARKERARSLFDTEVVAVFRQQESCNKVAF